MKKIICVSLLLILCLLPGLVCAESGKELIISAAASLKDVFQEIGNGFENSQRNVKVRFNFGASGILARQIEGGAPVDILASASVTEINALETEGLIVRGSRYDFAGNRIVLITPVSLKGIDSLPDLQKAGIRRIAIGSPKTVPAGKYSEEALVHEGLWESLKEKFIFTENVRQALDYVSRGEVDAAIVFYTDALVKLKNVRLIEIPADSYSKPIYCAAVIKNSSSTPTAKNFILYLKSPEAREILKKYGFTLPPLSSGLVKEK
jgi:molybdate transport system substrate-binding protein